MNMSSFVQTKAVIGVMHMHNDMQVFIKFENFLIKFISKCRDFFYKKRLSQLVPKKKYRSTVLIDCYTWSWCYLSVECKYQESFIKPAQNPFDSKMFLFSFDQHTKPWESILRIDLKMTYFYRHGNQWQD